MLDSVGVVGSPSARGSYWYRLYLEFCSARPEVCHLSDSPVGVGGCGAALVVRTYCWVCSDLVQVKHLVYTIIA